MTTLPIIYGSLAELSDILFRRIDQKIITLEMTQVHYDAFIYDLDNLENIYVGKFRPIKIDLDNDVCEWVFNGMLKFIIKIK